MEMQIRPRKIITASVAIAALVVVLFLSRENSPSPTAVTAIGGSTDSQIAALQNKLAASPSVNNYVSLALLYAQKARETADATYFAKADDLMDAAAKIEPDNSDILAVRAMNAMGRHDFKAGLAFGEQALALNKTKSTYYGIVGDADIELGRYDDAVANFQHMVDIKPNLASYNRVAYIRELYGDIPGAIDALKTAAVDDSAFKENVAYSYYELGKLYFRSDLVQAKSSFEHALALVPEYPPALEGLGKIAYAQGKAGDAESFFKRAVAALPIAQYAIDMGELYQAQGDTAHAAQQYLLAKVAFEKSASGGTNTDLEEAQFLAEHDVDLAAALEKARAAFPERPSILGADTLAWALYKNGMYAEAKTYTAKALRLGANDPLIVFHAGMIAKANGELAQAKQYLQTALRLSPNFSMIDVPIAQKTLQSL